MHNPPDESERRGEFVHVLDAAGLVKGPAQARIVADPLRQPPPARFLTILAALDRQRGMEAHGS